MKKKIHMIDETEMVEPSYADMPEKMLPAKKGPKAKADKQLDPATRKSWLGKRYPGAIESQWVRYDDYWVFVNELSQFEREYKKCIYLGRWFSILTMAQTITGCFVSAKYFQDNPDKLAKCGYSGRLCEPGDMFSAHDLDDKPIKVANKYDSSFTACGVSGHLFQGDHMLKIKASTKYKKVGIPYINNGLFKECYNCGSWFEKDHVKYRDDQDAHLCDDCYQKIAFANVIGGWDDKSHPPACYSTTFRYGHKLGKDGLIMATNKQEPVKAVRLFGVEAEVELHKPAVVALGKNRFHLALAVKQTLGSDFCAIKEDGSLILNGKYSGDIKYDPDGKKNGPQYAGFEIVSAPCDKDIHEKKWALLDKCAELHDEKGNRLLRSWDTTTCGLHVHVSRDSLSELQIGRMLRFINHKKNQKFIHKIAGRGSDVYCRYLDKEVVDILHPERVISPEEKEEYHRKRRVALNLSNYHTVEFRIFRGTIHAPHIMRNVDFCDAICDYCWPAHRSIKDMDDYGAFVYFVSKRRKQYKHLASWFVRQKQIVLSKIGKGADPKRFTLQPDMVADEPSHEPPPSLKKANVVDEDADNF